MRLLSCLPSQAHRRTPRKGKALKTVGTFKQQAKHASKIVKRHSKLTRKTINYKLNTDGSRAEWNSNAQAHTAPRTTESPQSLTKTREIEWIINEKLKQRVATSDFGQLKTECRDIHQRTLKSIKNFTNLWKFSARFEYFMDFLKNSLRIFSEFYWNLLEIYGRLPEFMEIFVLFFQANRPLDESFTFLWPENPPGISDAMRCDLWPIRHARACTTFIAFYYIYMAAVRECFHIFILDFKKQRCKFFWVEVKDFCKNIKNF